MAQSNTAKKFAKCDCSIQMRVPRMCKFEVSHRSQFMFLDQYVQKLGNPADKTFAISVDNSHCPYIGLIQYEAIRT